MTGATTQASKGKMKHSCLVSCCTISSREVPSVPSTKKSDTVCEKSFMFKTRVLFWVRQCFLTKNTWNKSFCVFVGCDAAGFAALKYVIKSTKLFLLSTQLLGPCKNRIDSYFKRSLQPSLLMKSDFISLRVQSLKETKKQTKTTFCFGKLTIAGVCRKILKMKTKPRKIVFYLNPLIMAKQEHLDVGSRNNLAPLFWALAASLLGQRGVSLGTSGENTQWHSAQWRPNSSSPHNLVGTNRTWLSTNSGSHFSHDGWRTLEWRTKILPFILPVTRVLVVLRINRHFPLAESQQDPSLCAAPHSASPLCLLLVSCADENLQCGLIGVAQSVGPEAKDAQVKAQRRMKEQKKQWIRNCLTRSNFFVLLTTFEETLCNSWIATASSRKINLWPNCKAKARKLGASLGWTHRVDWFPAGLASN